MAKLPIRYVSAEAATQDDFGVPFTGLVGEVIYDGRLAMQSQWAMMTQESWDLHSAGFLGTGQGQKYVRNEEGHLVKVAG